MMATLNASEVNSKAFSERSLFQFNAQWQNQNQQTVELSQFQGKPVVIAMFYAHCLYACPVIVSSMQALEKELMRNNIDMQFVLVTLNPETDTANVLKEFAFNRKLNLKNWMLLRGSERDTRTLAMLLNVKYKFYQDENRQTEIEHSNLMHFLDAQGELLFSVAGNASGIKEAMEKLVVKK